ncbi:MULTISPECIES: class I SAM-dependent methyltransferase [unclassified Aurantimonas]|uniref:class I SAM-dependent methyltransferase n=1 Tax=unclassified Aurantimonas TaxID=2638230 RepID=UPI002E195258|nr:MULTISPECIES: class I SAM-dependent methyltransferase [unclassified Aurantimonas]MEC5292971.1 class I SAM-dependent methyltransferase [Aurantimonas sp. C2-3-R2]MEC5414156.1 class I SAM-dependent methyltransferase [Aurantimonas sp. C2-4-R8]
MTKAAMSWEDAVRWCLAQPDMTDLSRDAYFGDPVQAARRYRDSAEFAAVRAMLPAQKGRALDLGAGNGILSWALAQDGWEVTAVEPDASTLVGAGAIRALAAATATPITVIEAFGEAIPLEAAGFDLVVARQVLHHAHDLPQFTKEMRRLSRPGATILTLRDHVISGPEQRAAFFERHPLHHLYGGENAFTLAAYRQALAGAGLIIDREMRSFQSVVNFDPMTPGELLDRIAAQAGPLRKPLRGALGLVPFGWLAQLGTAVDKRPGRLVSFLCRRGA